MSSPDLYASLSEEHFQCSLCLQVFSDPVTTPCGHNFCKTCLSQHWDSSEFCLCPACNKRFQARPEFSTNTAIDSITAQIKRRKVEAAESEAAAPGQVSCDVCADFKLKAAKSCLVCLTSFCEVHLEPHCRVPSLMRHQLTEPVENLEERVCVEHGKLLEMFCREERAAICLLCCQNDHKEHETVTVEEEAALQRGNMDAKMAEIRRMIEERMEKMTGFSTSFKMSKARTLQEMDCSDKLFAALTIHMAKIQTKLKSSFEQKQRKSRKRSVGLMEELQGEVLQLQSKMKELEEASQNNHHLQLLQTLQALSTMAGMKDWSKVKLYSDVCVQTLRRAMTHLVGCFVGELRSLTDTELTRMRQYNESVYFDEDTAGSRLVVTENGKRLKFLKTASSPLRAVSGRFQHPMVLGTKSFPSGRHYWEVQVGLRNHWDVGVAKATVCRKRGVALKPDNGFFAIGKRGLDYQAHCSAHTALHLSPRPRRIGVYLDYEEGRVSFYDVEEKLHIHSFTQAVFTESLFPYFYLYHWAKKSEALVLL